MNDSEIVENAANALEERKTDLSDKDLFRVNKFIEAGLPGIASVAESKMQKVMELYLSGKTYRQISRIMGVEKDIIMYLSHRYHWYPKKMEYYAELENTIRDRVIEAKIVSHDFLLQLTHFWQHRIGKKINTFLATGDEDVAESISAKDVAIYLKAVETMEKLGSGKKERSGSPTVGLNLGDGVTVKKLGDNEVEITPKQKTIQDMMRDFANSRRDEDKKLAKSSDIKDNDSEEKPA
jgi:hypothetical protein